MCGRYALALRPSQIRRILEEDNVPVADAPEDEGNGTPRQSYNFAPGYCGVVYRADTPDWGTWPSQGNAHRNRRTSKAEQIPEKASELDTSATKEVKYKLQSMKWGLIPSWTKQNPNYASIMRTINCRADSLSSPGGMWSTIKARKRCIVIAQGFFEWLNIGPKHKLPHYVKRKDGRLMCFAGLWDCVQYQGNSSNDKNYTYTIITTDSNKQLKFLHDRMPVIFDPGSDKLQKWINPSQHEWSRELQSLLKPFDGDLELYPVKADVGKVGNNSPSFVIPLNSEKNKSNIANFFPIISQQEMGKGETKGTIIEERNITNVKRHLRDDLETDSSIANETAVDRKRKTVPDIDDNSSPAKRATTRQPDQRGAISSTRNTHKVHAKSRLSGVQTITKFFPQGA